MNSIFNVVTLKARLSAVICFLTLMSIGIGLLGLYGMNQANQGLKAVYTDRTVALELVSRIDCLMVQSQLALAEALQDSVVATINIKSAQVDKNVAEINQAWAVYMASNLTAQERALADKYAADRTRLMMEGFFPVMTAMRAGKLADASQMQDQFQPMVPAVRASVNALRKLQVDEAKNEYEKSRNRYAVLRNLVIAAIALSAAVAALSGFFLARTIYRQLGGEPDYAARIVRSIAAGDLTVTVETKPDDQCSLLFAMKGMQQNLAQTVGKIRQSTDTVETASIRIAASNLDLSSRTEEQANSLAETVSSMADLTRIVKQNAGNAQQANHLAQSASAVASKGGVAVLQVADTMQSINASSRKIADVIGIIDGIAFQTNILALNATVEAAHAGEQGRGFAVVAAEVRSLSQRSAAAAKAIKELIEESVIKTEAGSILVAQAGATMNEIVESVKRVTNIMHGITDASQQQHVDIRHINQAINQMDMVIQQNAALVVEAAVTADSLQGHAAILAEVVSVFKLDTLAAGAQDAAAKIVAYSICAIGPEGAGNRRIQV
jgi:methyl-accepting chemotaxis protein-1 (serine sensor receptor)